MQTSQPHTQWPHIESSSQFCSAFLFKKIKTELLHPAVIGHFLLWRENQQVCVNSVVGTFEYVLCVELIRTLRQQNFLNNQVIFVYKKDNE